MTGTEEKTLRIKLLQGIATQRRTYDPGAEIDWPEAEARRFIELGYATLVETMERMAPQKAERR